MHCFFVYVNGLSVFNSNSLTVKNSASGVQTVKNVDLIFLKDVPFLIRLFKIQVVHQNHLLALILKVINFIRVLLVGDFIINWLGRKYLSLWWLRWSVYLPWGIHHLTWVGEARGESAATEPSLAGGISIPVPVCKKRQSILLLSDKLHSEFDFYSWIPWGVHPPVHSAINRFLIPVTEKPQLVRCNTSHIIFLQTITYEWRTLTTPASWNTTDVEVVTKILYQDISSL